MSIARPSYFKLKDYFDEYLSDSQPCKFGYKNQCAIRLSLALSKCGMTFERFTDQKRIHQGRKDCKLGDVPHIVGAEELKDFLAGVWDTGLKDKSSVMRDKILFTRGIIYFNDCFKRGEDDPGTSGDHIDLWTGTKYYNQVLGISAGGNARAKTDLFSRANCVQFFWLPE